jgi:hypothetical protein
MSDLLIAPSGRGGRFYSPLLLQVDDSAQSQSGQTTSRRRHAVADDC